MKSISNQSIRIALQMTACLFLALGFVIAQSQAADSGAVPKVTPNISGSRALPLDQAVTPNRSRTPTLTPTIVPIPRTSARGPLSVLSIPGQPQVDANTVALYHLDTPNGNLAIDETGNYTGTLYGNATIATTGLYGGVLHLDGSGSFLRTGNVGSLTSGTIEAFVDFANACYGTVGYPFTVFSAGGEYGSSQQVLWLGDDGYLKFEIVANSKLYIADSRINPCRYLAGGNTAPYFYAIGKPAMWPYETWRFHHVAGTWGPRGIEIWVDGVLHGVGQYVADPNNPPSDTIDCNPQTQELSVNYPICDYPVMGLVPGSYGGALPPYTTFLIGCDQFARCLNGRVDEVRISNIQRIFSATVDPTTTPTPTWTPVSISGAESVDPNTLALYHFNPAPAGETWEEVSQQYKYLSGQAVIVSGGRFGSGLLLDGNGSYLRTGNLGSLYMGAVEAWVSFASPVGYQPIFASTEYYNSTGSLLFLGGNQGDAAFGIYDGNNMHWVDSGVRISSLIGCWHHLAGTWGPRGAEVWVDGSLMKSDTSYTGGMIQVFDWRVGCDFGGLCTTGTLDEVRVSNIQRTFTSATLRPVRAAPFVLRSPCLGTPRAPLAASGLGNLVFLPFVQVAPTPAAPPCL